MINCLIIEDTFTFAIRVKMQLRKMELNVLEIASNLSEAKSIIDSKRVDIILSDVMLENGEKSTDLFSELDLQIPIILFSGYKTEEIIKKVHLSRPYIFLTKPFTDITFESAVRGALRNKLDGENELKEEKKEVRSVFFKDKGVLQAIDPQNIVYVHSEGNHCSIILENKKLLVRSSLGKLKDKLPQITLLQVHRSHLINVAFINKIALGENIVCVNNHPIPIGRKYKGDLLALVTENE